MKLFKRLPFQKENSESRPLLVVFWWFLFLLVICLFVMYSVIDVWEYTGRDFEIFYTAAGDLWNGRSPYEELLATYADSRIGHYPIAPWGHYLYPTNFACLMIPFLVFPVFWAKKVYVALSIIIFVPVFLKVFTAVLPPNVGPFRRKGPDPQVPLDRAAAPLSPWSALFLFAVGFLWGPAIDTFRLGQSNVPVFLLFFASWWSARKDREILAGIFLGLGCSIKLTPILIIPLVVAAWRPKLVAAALGSFFLSFVICFPQYHWRYFTTIVPALSAISTVETAPSAHAAILYGARRWGFDPGRWATVFPMVYYAACLLRVFLSRRLIRADGVLLLGMLITPALAADCSHHYMIALFPMMWLMGGLLERGQNVGTVWRVGLLLLLLVSAYYQMDVPKEISSRLSRSLRIMDGQFFSLGCLATALIFWKTAFLPRPVPTEPPQ
jgi:hypothetical protein